MTQQSIKKRRVVISYNNLSAELQAEVKAYYPKGFTEAMIRIEKPNGDLFYAVPFDTEEVAYLIKIDVKVDKGSRDDDDKDLFDDHMDGSDEMHNDGEESSDNSDMDDDVDI